MLSAGFSDAERELTLSATFSDAERQAPVAKSVCAESGNFKPTLSTERWNTQMSVFRLFKDSFDV